MNSTQVTGPTSFAELMSLYDVEFVEAAYPILLGRPADPIGLNYYVDRLRRGFSRISVLDQLAKSREVVKEWDKFPGISGALAKLRASRRASGWKLALGDIELGRTPAIRRVRALQNSIASHRQQLEQLLTKLTLRQDILYHIVSDLSADASSWGLAPATSCELGAKQEIGLPELRTRRVEEVRDFDLPPSARAVLSELRF